MSKQPAKPGDFTHSVDSISVEGKAFIQNKMTQRPDGSPILGDDGQAVKYKVVPARENGTYKGSVILNNDTHIVQKINDHTAVSHLKSDVNLKGNGLKERDDKNNLHGAEVQIFYSGAKANAYPWNSAKAKEAITEQSQQQQAAIKEQLSTVYDTAQKDFIQKAMNYANTEIKNAKSREAFLKHLTNLAGVDLKQQTPTKAQPAESIQHQQEKVHAQSR